MVLAAYTLEQAEQDISDVRGLLDTLLEAHTIMDGPTPNVPDSSGVTLYSATGNLAVINVSSLSGNVPMNQSAFFPNNTVTAATLQNLAQGTYKGGDADVGAVYQVTLMGNGVQGTVGNRQTL